MDDVESREQHTRHGMNFSGKRSKTSLHSTAKVGHAKVFFSLKLSFLFCSFFFKHFFHADSEHISYF